ncbi:MAG TPA: amidohydrolase family protein [Gemmatimonadales bacterium]|nr:amidohydrolase family protein [Gemmatimonadales bacterium]
MAQQTSVDQPVVIVNVNVLPMDVERVLEGQTVIVQNGRITSMGSARSVRVPSGMQTIDGSGKYLIPGFADVHVHFHGNPPDEQPLLLPLFLANGVTTVLSLRGAPEILELRNGVAAGRVFGPRLYTVGPYINEPFVTTPDEVEQAVIEQKRAGYDFVKLHGDLSREAYHRLLVVARREGIRVVGHAPRNLGIETMFAERPAQYALAHAEEFLYDHQNRSTDSSLSHVVARIPELARATAEARIWLMPNLTAYKMIARMVHDLDAVLARPEVRYLPRSNQVIWGPATNPYTNRIRPDRYEPMMRRYALLEKLVREFHARGVRMLVGTDAMNTGVVPGFSAHDEMADLVRAGLPRYEVLRAATANAAEFLGEKGERGTVAVGQRADLVLLDANPLVDIANTRRIAGVMLRGRWLSAGDIAAMLERLRSRS